MHTSIWESFIFTDPLDMRRLLKNRSTIYDLQKEEYGTTGDNNFEGMNIYSDGTLIILDSMQNDNFKVKFSDLFPVSLSTLQFDATLPDSEFFTAEVSFKYLNYTIVKGSGFV